MTSCTPDKTKFFKYTKVYEETACPQITDVGAKKQYMQYKEYIEDNWTGSEIKQVEVIPTKLFFNKKCFIPIQQEKSKMSQLVKIQENHILYI